MSAARLYIPPVDPSSRLESARDLDPPRLPYEAQLLSGQERVKEIVRTLISWSAAPLGTVIRVATKEPAIALTFDDGPDPQWTPAILDVLARHGALATFFAVGKRVRDNPALVERMRNAGHAIANHSWDHSSFRRIDGRFRRAQIRWCGDVLGAQAARLFRPPYAEQSLASRLDALRCGHQVVLGDVVAEDWRDDSAEILVARVLRRLRRGSIVLWHDSLHSTHDARFRDRGPTCQALETLLERLSPAFRFVTVPALLRLGRPVRWHSYHRLPLEFHRHLL
jgi:peptidoglycan-N-acetylglucosamine deacetylase